MNSSKFVAKLTEDVEKRQQAERLSSDIDQSILHIQQLLSSDQQTPSYRLDQIQQLELQIQEQILQLDSLRPQAHQFSPLIEPYNVPIQELRRRLDLALTGLVNEKRRIESEQTPVDLSKSEELSPGNLQTIPAEVDPSIQESIEVKTHELPATSTTTTISVVEEELPGVDQIDTSQTVIETPIPAIVTKTTTIVEQQEEPKLVDESPHAQVYAPSTSETTFETVKEEELQSVEPLKEAVDKRTPQERLLDLLENTENLLQNEDMSNVVSLSNAKKCCLIFSSQFVSQNIRLCWFIFILLLCRILNNVKTVIIECFKKQNE